MNRHCYTVDTARSMAVWVQIITMLLYGILWTLPANCQNEFISIDCGSNASYTDRREIEWSPDGSYVTTGKDFNDVSSSSGIQQLSSLRYFAGRGRTRDCYVLPTKPGKLYLIRPTFDYGDLSRISILDLPAPNFTVYVDGIFWFRMSICPDGTSGGYSSYERILYSLDTVIRMCLVREEHGLSFISSLELRPLEDGMYSALSPPLNYRREQQVLNLFGRYNFGPIGYNVRYPDDKFDRIWRPSSFTATSQELNSSYVDNVDAAQAPNLPPGAVMEDAITYYDGTTLCWWYHVLDDPVGNLVAISYFQELDSNVSAANARGMNYILNGDRKRSFNSSSRATQVDGISWNIKSRMINISLQSASWSNFSPIWNALEYYTLTQYNVTQTADNDWVAAKALRSNFDISYWDGDLDGDPCIPAGGGWIDCTLDSANQSQYRVTSLYLTSRKTPGPIPNDIFKFEKLTTLSIENSSVTGIIPDFSRLSSLQSLSLRNNKLEGNIDGLSKLTRLISLNLENNSLSGPIPAFLGKFQNLTELHLDNNNFSGAVPTALSNKKDLTLTYSNNQISGSSTTNVKAIVGGLLGGIIALIVISVLVWHFATRKRRAKAKILREIRNQGDRYKGEAASFGSLQVFTLEQVSQATKKFSRKIGQGGFGGVYYGNLSKGEEVAAKVGAGNSGQGGLEFQNELELLSRIHHANLVSLVGYCNEENQEILIYDYVPNGTLRDHLNYRETSKTPLSWKTRLNIAVNSATGLEYLHLYCKPRIIHRDIKSSNILLDKNMVAKVADFGISKQTLDESTTGVQTVLKGTLGYIDPEYFSSQILTPKSDVYSFGVLLLEILSGHFPVPRQFDDGATMSLVEWAQICEEEGNAAEFFDPAMGHNIDINYQSLKMVFDLALESTNPVSKYRPDMQQVLRRLFDAARSEEEESGSSQRTDEEEDADHFRLMISHKS